MCQRLNDERNNNPVLIESDWNLNLNHTSSIIPSIICVLIESDWNLNMHDLKVLLLSSTY